MVTAKVAEMGLGSLVLHSSYTDLEAAQIARKVELVPGTATNVAQKLKTELNQALIDRIKGTNPDTGSAFAPYNDSG